MPIIAAAALLALAGCARHDAAVRIGEDTYRTSAHAGRGDAAVPARQRALSEAGRKCASLGRDTEVVDVRGPAGAGDAATVTFRCIARIHR